jgi:hypothetical protein
MSQKALLKCQQAFVFQWWVRMDAVLFYTMNRLCIKTPRFLSYNEYKEFKKWEGGVLDFEQTKYRKEILLL